MASPPLPTHPFLPPFFPPLYSSFSLFLFFSLCFCSRSPQKHPQFFFTFFPDPLFGGDGLFFPSPQPLRRLPSVHSFFRCLGRSTLFPDFWRFFSFSFFFTFFEKGCTVLHLSLGNPPPAVFCRLVPLFRLILYPDSGKPFFPPFRFFFVFW